MEVTHSPSLRNAVPIVSRWGHRLLQELTGFFRAAAGNILTAEFMVVLIPLIVAWELLPQLAIVPKTLVPPPSLLVPVAFDLVANSNFLKHIGDSMVRFSLGIFFALITAIPIGTLMGWNVSLRKHGLPLFQILAPIPPPAWVPVTMILFGVGLPMQVFLIYIGAFYPILFNTYQGVKETDPRYIASARVFGASELTTIRYVYLPNAMSSIVMGIKIGIAMGLVMLVISEMIGAGSGIGWLLLESKEFFRIDRMVICMLTLGAIGWLLIEVMKYIELKLAVWKVDR